MGTQNDVGGKGCSVEGYKGYDELVVTLQQRAGGDAARGDVAALAFEGLNDVVVLAFQLQWVVAVYVCSKGIPYILAQRVVNRQ